MKNSILFLLLFVCVITKAQNTYYKAYDAGAALSQDTKCIIKTMSGGLAIATFDSIIQLFKTDLNGTIIWKKQFHHLPKFFLPVRITQDLVDSSFYLSTGYFGNSNLSINKIDNSGNLIWSKTLPLFTGSAFICSSIGGGFILASCSNYDNYLLRFDGGGNIVWQKRYQNSPPYAGSTISDIVQCKNNDYVISGSCINSGWDPEIFRVDSSGVLKWFNIYDLGPDNEFLKLSAKGNDQSILLCGTSNNSAYYSSLYFRIDSIGTILNFKKYHNIHDPAYSIILSTGPNRLLMAGNALYPGFMNTQDLYTYMDYTGTVLWNKTSGNSLYSSGGGDYIGCGTTVSPNSFVLGGSGEGKFITMIDTSGNGFCNSDTILLKDTTYTIPVLTPTITTGAIFYTPSNNVITVTVPPTALTSFCNVTLGLNSEFNNIKGQAAFPNPVSRNSFLEFKSDVVEENSEIIINDVWGRKIYHSKLDERNNKIYTFNWESGIYFILLIKNDKSVSSGKICVIDKTE